VKVRSDGRVLAKGTVRLKAGDSRRVSVKLTKVGRSKIRGVTSARIVVDPSRGRTVKRTVTISR
ncbi:MAG: hypothetical protein WBP61_15485, partial [Nocardioides sp.]